MPAHGRRSEGGVNPDFDESESESWSSSSGGDSSRQAEEGGAGHRRRRRAHKASEHDDSGEQSEPDDEDPRPPRSARPKRRSAGSTPAAGGDQAQAADQGPAKETTDPRARSSSHRRARFAEDSDLVDELGSRRRSADRRERAERHDGERSRADGPLHRGRYRSGGRRRATRKTPTLKGPRSPRAIARCRSGAQRGTHAPRRRALFHRSAHALSSRRGRTPAPTTPSAGSAALRARG